MRTRLSYVYLTSTVVLMLVAPVVSILVAIAISASAVSLWDLIGTWFVFWAAGVRLLLAGMRQVIQPSFTARTIFGLTDAGSHTIVRELGFGNICQGVLGVVSLFVPQWRLVAAIIGGLFFGLAGAAHVVRRPDGPNEVVALISDCGIFIILAAYAVHAVVATGSL